MRIARRVSLLFLVCLALLPTSAFAQRTTNGRVAVLAADSTFTPASAPSLTSDPAQFGDVAQRIWRTGLFQRVDQWKVHAVGSSCLTVTPDLLLSTYDYDAVLVYSNSAFCNQAELGAALAAFLDAGRGVVFAPLSFQHTFVGSREDPKTGLAGNVVTDGAAVSYSPLLASDYRYGDLPTAMSLVVSAYASHPIFERVKSFTGGALNARNEPAWPTSPATVLAHWSNGTPLVAVIDPAPPSTRGRSVTVNSFAAGAGALTSAGGRDDRLWTGDGQWLFANALVWASRRTQQGPSVAGSLFPEANAAGWVGQAQLDAESRETVRVRLEAVTGGSLANIASITYSAVGATTASGTANVDTPAAHFETFLEIGGEGVTEIRYYATADDGLVSAERTLYVRIDRVAPLVRIDSPAGTYERGALVLSSVRCEDALSGVSSCSTNSIVSGSPVPTSQVGSFAFEAHASDVAGNVGHATSPYTVTKVSTSVALRILPALIPQFVGNPWLPRAGEAVRFVVDVIDVNGQLISSPDSPAVVEIWDDSETPSRLLGALPIGSQVSRGALTLLSAFPAGDHNIRVRFTDTDPGYAGSSAGKTLRVTADAGTLKTWGQNEFGQLGHGHVSSLGVLEPAREVRGLRESVAFAAGATHSLAILRDGTVWTWGSILDGTGVRVPRLTPVPVPDVSRVVAIAAGHDFSVALRADGSVWTWGTNSAGQLGRAAGMAFDARPAPVPNLGSVVAVVAGWRHVLALRSDGSVWAWGANQLGELGTASGESRSPVPVRVLLPADIRVVAAGGRHSLALDSSGRAWAWGDNAHGQLGDGTTTERPAPVTVATRIPFVSLAADLYGSTGLGENGEVWRWGATTGAFVTQPSPVRLPDGRAVASGTYLGLARRSDGTVWQWGKLTGSTATRVPLIATTFTLAAGFGHAGAIVGHDTVPPTVSATLAPANASGWANSVAVTLTAMDLQSVVSSITYRAEGAEPLPTTIVDGGSAVVPFTKEGVSTLSYAAVDAAGNTGALASATVRVDSTPPIVSTTFGAAGGPAPLLRIGAQVPLDYSCGDGLSGIASCWARVTSADAQVDTWLTTGSALPTGAAGTYMVEIEARDHALNQSTTVRTYRVTSDTTGPAIAITEPYGRLFTVGQEVRIAFSCTDPESGVGSCSGRQHVTAPEVGSGALLDTGSTGPFAFTITARDGVGNTSTRTFGYTVGTRLALLVADNLGNRILAYDLDNPQRGAKTFIEGHGLAGPTCMVEHLGYLYVCNPTQYEVLRFNAVSGTPAGAPNRLDAVFITNVGNRGAYSGPSGLTIGPDGDLYVATNAGGVIERYNLATGAPRGLSAADARVFATVGTQHNSSSFGPDGNLYVANFTPASVPRFDGRTGRFLNEFLSDGWTKARNADLTWGPDGLLYLGARYDGRPEDPGGYIHRYDANSTGVPGPGFGVAHGRAPVVELSTTPGLMSFGPDGQLYVSTWAYGGTYGLVRFDPVRGQASIEHLPLPTGSGPSGLAFSRDVPVLRQTTSIRLLLPADIDDDGVRLHATFNGAPRSISAVAVNARNEEVRPVVITYNDVPDAPTNAGRYLVEATFAGDEHNEPSTVRRELNIRPAQVSIDITSTAAVYDGDPSPATVTVTPQAPYTVTYNGAAEAPVNAGDYEVVVTVSDPNYVETEARAMLSIAKAQPLVQIHDQRAIVYGTPLPDITARADVPGAFRMTPAAGTVLPAGHHRLSVRFVPDDSANVEEVSFEQVIEVLKGSARIEVIDLSVVYTGQPSPMTGRVVGAMEEALGVPEFVYAGSLQPPTDAGVYPVLARYGGDDNHVPAELNVMLTIKKAQPVLNLSGGRFTYTGTSHPATATATGVAGEAIGPLTITYNGATAAPVAAGTYQVAAELAESRNHLADRSTATIVIDKAAATVSVTGGTVTYDGQPHAVAAVVTGVNGEDLGPVTLKYGGSPQPPVKAGTYLVTGTFDSDRNYESATGHATLVINKAPALLTVADGTFTYDGAKHEAVVTLTGVDGATIGPVTIAYGGLAAGVVPVDAGAYDVIATFGGNDDYERAEGRATLVINRATPTVMITGGSFTYDGHPHPATGRVIGVNGEDLGTVALRYDGDPQAPVNAGTYAVVGIFAGDRNHEPATGTETIAIDKAAPTVSVTGGTFTYDAAPHAAWVVVTGVRGEQRDGSVQIVYNAMALGFVPVDAGTYEVFANYAGDENYERAQGRATIVINRATPTLTVTAGTFTYDGQPHAAGATLSGVNGEELGRVTLTYDGSTAVPVNAGIYQVVATFSGDGNYEPSTGTATLVVNKAVPSVAWDAPASIVHGQPLGTAQLNASAGVAGTFTYSPAAGTLLGAGMHQLSATFVPTDTANYTEQTASTRLTVAPAATTTTLTSSLNPARFDQALTFTARLAVVAPGAGTPGGSVTFYDGTMLIGTGTVGFDGTAFVASLTTTLAGGDHSITAQYGGTPDHLASTSAALIQTVFGPPTEPGRPADPGPPANRPGRGSGRR